jgi:hypothetical protein
MRKIIEVSVRKRIIKDYNKDKKRIFRTYCLLAIGERFVLNLLKVMGGEEKKKVRNWSLYKKKTRGLANR